MLKKIKVTNFKGFRDEETILFDKNNIIENNKTSTYVSIIDLKHQFFGENFKRSLYGLPQNIYSKEAKSFFEFHFEFDGVSVVYKYSKIGSLKFADEFLYMNGELVLKLTEDEIVLNIEGVENLNRSYIKEQQGSMSLVNIIYNNSLVNKDSSTGDLFIKLINFVKNMVNYKFTATKPDNQKLYLRYTPEESFYFENVIKHDKVKEFQDFLEKLTKKTFDLVTESKYIHTKVDEDTEVSLNYLLSDSELRMALLFNKLVVPDAPVSMFVIDDSFVISQKPHHYFKLMKTLDDSFGSPQIIFL